MGTRIVPDLSVYVKVSVARGQQRPRRLAWDHPQSMELIAFGLGVLLLAVAFWDLFETIVVPRPTPGWFRLGRYLVRGSWRVLRSVRDGNPNRSYDRALGLFAPAATVALLVTWLAALIVGYGLLMYALRDELQPVPPSAVTLLETYAQLGLIGRLPDFFLEWQRWAVEVLDSHVAYPLLGFFRSSHDNLSWISALGSVLDAASLVLTTIEDVPRGEAKLFKRVGAHLVEDIYNLGFHAGEPSTLDRSAFEAACARLTEAGYRLCP